MVYSEIAVWCAFLALPMYPETSRALILGALSRSVGHLKTATRNGFLFEDSGLLPRVFGIVITQNSCYAVVTDSGAQRKE